MSVELKAAKDTAWKWFSLYTRLKDSLDGGIVKCCTCTTYHKYNDRIQAGHYYTQAARRGLIFNEKNCHPQCISCNDHKSGNLSVYSTYLIERYGVGILDELLLADRIYVPYRESDYRELATKYRLLVKQLKNKKGIE